MLRDLEKTLNKYPELPQLFDLFKEQFSSEEELTARVFAKAKKGPIRRIGNCEMRGDIYENIKLPPLGPLRIFEASFNNGRVRFSGLLCRDGDLEHIETLELYFEFFPGEKVEFNKICVTNCCLSFAYIE